MEENKFSELEKKFQIEPEDFSLFMSLIEHYNENKNWEKLVNLYLQRICFLQQEKEEKGLDKLYLQLGSIFEEKMGKKEKALEYYKLAKKHNDRNPKLLHKIAELTEQAGDLSQTIETLRLLLKISNTSEQRDCLNFKLAELWKKTGEKENATTCYCQIHNKEYQNEIFESLESMYEKQPESLALILTEKLEDIKDNTIKIQMYKKLATLQNNKDASIAFLQRALELEPSNCDIRKDISEIFFEKEDFTLWLEYQKQILNMSSENTENIENIHTKIETPGTEIPLENIIKAYETILEYVPDDIVAIERLIELYKRSKNHEGLKKVLIQKSKYCPLAEKVSVYFQIAKVMSESLGASEEASEYYKKVQQLENNRESLNALKEQYFNEGKIEELITILKKKIQTEPEHASSYLYEIAIIYRDRLNDLDTCISYLKSSIKNNPKYIPSFQALCPILRSKNLTADYLIYIEKQILATSNQESRTKLHLEMVEIYLKKENFTKAENHLLQILQDCVDHPIALNKLAIIYKTTEQWSNYVKILERINQYSQDNVVERYTTIAKLYEEKLQQYDNACISYKKALFFDSYSEDILLKLKDIALKLKDDDCVLYCLNKLSFITSNYKQASDFLIEQAQIYERKANKDQAILSYKKALDKTPFCEKILNKLICIYKEKEAPKELLEILQKKARIIKDDEELKRIYTQIIEITREHNQQELSIKYLEKLYELERSNNIVKEHLPKLYSQTRKLKKLVFFYENQLEQSPEQNQLELLKKIRSIYQSLDDKAKQKNICKQILTLKYDEEILQHFKEVSKETKDWKNLIFALELEKKHTNSLKILHVYKELSFVYLNYLPNIDNALTILLKILELQPEDFDTLENIKKLYIFKQEYTRAIEIIDQQMSIANTPNARTKLLKEKSLIYRDSLHKPKEAALELTKALKFTDNPYPILHMLDGIYREKKDFHKLVEILEQKWKCTQDESIYIEIVNIYENILEDEEKTEQLLQRLLKTSPNIEIAKKLEYMYKKRENWKKLEELYKGLIKNTSKKEKIFPLYSLGKLYERYFQKDQEAAGLFVQILTIDPSHIPTIKSLQKIYKANDDIAALVESYLAELAIYDISPKRRIRLHLICGRLFYKELNKTELAISHYNQVLKLEANNTIAIKELQNVYRDNNNHDKLITMLLAELTTEQNIESLFKLHFELSNIYIEQAIDIHKGINHLVTAYEYKPDNKSVLLQLKNILRKYNKWEEYIQYCEIELEKIDIPEEKQKLHLELSEIYNEKLHISQKAIFHIEQAYTIGNISLEKCKLLEKLYKKEEIKDPKKLATLFKKQIELESDPERLLQLYKNTGLLYYRNKMEEQAKAYFEKVFTLDPYNKKIANMLSKLYIKNEQWKKLILLFEKRSSITSEPEEKVKNLTKIGNIWEKKLKERHNAISYYQRILLIAPNHIEAISSIRRIYEHQKNWYGVVDLLHKEVKHYTGKKQAALYLKIAKLWEKKLDSIPQAVQAYLKMLKVHFHMEAAQHTISLLRDIKDYETMQKIIQKIIQKSKNTEEKNRYLYELGKIFTEHTNKQDKAILVYQKILKTNPENIEVLSSLEEIYAQRENWEELCKIKEKKLEILSESTERKSLHFDLGQIYQNEIFHEKKAMIHYEYALELEPENCSIMIILQLLYKKWGYFHKYVMVCEQEIRFIDNQIRKIEILHQVSQVWREELFDDTKALEALERIIDIQRNNKEALVLLGKIYQKNSDYTNLVRIYKLQVELLEGKEGIPLYNAIGRILYENLSLYQDAIKAFSEVLLLDSSNIYALHTLEKIYIEQKDYEKLIENLKAQIALEKTPDKALALKISLAKLYRTQHMENEAITIFEEAKQLSAKNSEIISNLKELYQITGNTTCLEAINKEIASTSTNQTNQISSLLSLAELHKDSNPTKSIESLEQVLVFDKENSKAFKLLFDLYYKNKNFENALELLNSKIELEEKQLALSKLYEKRAQIYLDLEEEQNALEDLEKSYKLNDGDINIISALSHLYYKMEKWEKARSLYETIIRWSKANRIDDIVEIKYRLGKIACKLENKDIAVLRFQEVLGSNPEHIESLKKLGDIYYDNNQWEKALLIYMKLGSLSCGLKDQKINLRLSAIKNYLGMAEGAIEGYLKLLEHTPENITAIEALGHLYFERKEEDRALEYFTKLEKIAKKSETRKTALVYIGKIHEYLENIQDTINTYKILMEYNDYKKIYTQKLIQFCIKYKRWEEAKKYAIECLEIVETNDEKAKVYTILGNIFWNGSKDGENATHNYKKAVQLSPMYFPAITSIMEIYKEKHQWEKIEIEYEKYLENFPERMRDQKVPILYDLAKILENKQKKYDKAIEKYEEILEIEPQHISTHSALSFLLAKFPEKRFQAISENMYLLSKDPFRLISYHELFSLYMSEKDYDRAYLSCQVLDLFNDLLPEEQKFLKLVSPRVASGWIETTTLDNFILEKNRGTFYEILGIIDPFTDKAYPVNIEEKYNIDRKNKLEVDSENPIWKIVNTVAHLLRTSDISIYLGDTKYVTIENTVPASIIINEDFMNQLSERGKYFLIAKQLFYISRNHIMANKLSLIEYTDYISRLVEAFADTGKETDDQKEAISRKLRNNLPRKIRRQLEERMDILTEVFQTNIEDFLVYFEYAANNCALLISDSLKESCKTHCIIKQKDLKDLTKYDEIRELLLFHISDEHHRLRKELGIAVKWINKY